MADSGDSSMSREICNDKKLCQTEKLNPIAPFGFRIMGCFVK